VSSLAVRSEATMNFANEKLRKANRSFRGLIDISYSLKLEDFKKAGV
jgi:hypothetical protein